MKKKITFYELLTMMKNGTAPDKVIYDGEAYYKVLSWYNKGSEYDLNHSFSRKFNMFGMIEGEEIEYDDNILTKKEKAYLSAVLKPFKEREMRITKMDSADGYNLVVDGEEDEEGARDLYYFPVFPHDSEMYRGMEVDRAYTPSELGLWEKD